MEEIISETWVYEIDLPKTYLNEAGFETTE